MAHARCDVLDVLEEAVVKKQAVAVTLQNGNAFTDWVSDVVTREGHDFGVFQEHGEIPVGEISQCSPAA